MSGRLTKAVIVLLCAILLAIFVWLGITIWTRWKESLLILTLFGLNGGCHANASPVTNVVTVSAIATNISNPTNLYQLQKMIETVSATNKNFKLAVGYFVAVMAGHAPPKPPVGVTSNDLAEAYFEMFVAPRLNAKLIPAQRPIEFYGKVIDENSNPVEGASVSFNCNQVFPERTIETNTVSDSDGLFSISGISGASLGVYVEKNGYYSVSRLNQEDFQYWAVPNAVPFHPNPNNPVIFHLRKKGIGVDLITSKHGISPYLTIAAPKDGTPVWVDLLQSKGGSSGQLEIQTWLEIDPDTHRTKSWRLKLLIPDGGFVEVQDEFAFMAPENGYQPELDFPIPDDKGNTRFGISQKNYYIAFGNPRLYGRLEVNASDQTGEIWFQYVINPNGSRNLEPKSSSP